MRSFIHSKVMVGVPNFKFRSRDPDPAHFRGQFLTHWLVHVMFNVCTKYEVSSFGNAKDIKGVPKFRKWSRDLSYAHQGFMQCISPQNLECVALSIRKLWRGSQIVNLGHVTLTSPTLGASLLCIG